MLESNIIEESTKDFNIELIKGDVQFLSTYITTFLQFLLKQDVNTLKSSFLNNTSDVSVLILKRFFHMVLVYKVPYMSQSFINPRRVFSRPDEGQRSAFLLNISTLLLTISTCRDYDSRNIKIFDILAKEMKDFFMPNPSDAEPLWFTITHVELLTQILISKLMAFRDNANQSNKAFRLSDTLHSTIETVFESYIKLPIHHQRKQDISFLVGSEIYQKQLGLDETINLLSQKYPYSKFVEITWDFIKKSYNQISTYSRFGPQISPSSELILPFYSDPMNRKRRKTTHINDFNSDTDEEIETLTYHDSTLDHLTQFSTVNLDPGNESSNNGSQEKHKIASSNLNSKQPIPTGYVIIYRISCFVDD